MRGTDEELIKNFKKAQPTVVGLSGIFSQSYPNLKRVSKILRELFPDIWIIAGGHVTASANVILNKTETDICVIGDGEIPFVNLIDYFKKYPTNKEINYDELALIKGLAFMDENHKLKATGYGEQLAAHEMEFPDYDKLEDGLKKFGGKEARMLDYFKTINQPSDLVEFLQGQDAKQVHAKTLELFEKVKYQRLGRTLATRGCVARCTFCQRYTRGFRVYKAETLESHLTKLKEKYDVKIVALNDENFGSNRKDCYEIARVMKKLDLYWMSTGARSKSFKFDDLKFYKEHNMMSVKFGIESGSQKMLDVMEKKFTPKNIYDAVEICKKLDISTSVDGFIIGMPGETEQTIIENGEFLATLWDLLGFDWNTRAYPYLAIAIPGTPLYEYSQQIGVIGKTIDEEEDYLIRLSGYRITHILNYINKTSYSAKEVNYWTYLFPYAAKKAFVNLIIKKNKSLKNAISEIYKKCLKGSINDFVVEINKRKHHYRKESFLKKFKWFTLISINFFFSLGCIFLPKIFLFSLIRLYANLRFYYLEKAHKVKDGVQKYNLFVEQSSKTEGKFVLDDVRANKADRQIDLSLRTIVMDNRKKGIQVQTNEERDLQILSAGQ